MERRSDDPGALRLSADLDGDVFADDRVGRLDVRERDGFLDGWTERARRDDAQSRTVRHHRIAVSRNGAVRHLETDELSLDALRARRFDRRTTHEITLDRLHDPAESGLERVRRLVDVVAVERVGHLESQRV